MSSKSHSGRLWLAAKAMALPASSELPPPKAITPSALWARRASQPAATSDPVGSLATSLNSGASSPAARTGARASAIIGLAADLGR